MAALAPLTECFEDFDSSAQAATKFAHLGANVALSTANPRTSTKHLRFNTSASSNANSINTASSWRRLFGGPRQTFGVAMGLHIAALPSRAAASALGGMQLMSFLTQGGLCQFWIGLDTDGSLAIFRGYNYSLNGGGFTLIHQSVPCISPGEYLHIEVKGHISTTAGSVEVRINGVPRIAITNVNNQAQTATAEASQVFQGFIGAAVPGCGNIDIDDLHGWDTAAGEGPTDFTGNTSVIKNALVSDAADDDWTLSAGSDGFALLDDNDDATLITGETVGDRSSFGTDADPAEVVQVLYRQINFRALKTDTGDASITASLQVGGDETAMAEQAMSAAATWYMGAVQNNPDTGVAWAPGEMPNVVFERTL